MAGEHVNVEIRGAAQLAAGMRVLARNIQQAAIRDGVRASARQAAENVRGRVPVRSGRLRGSVRDTMRGDIGEVTMGAGLAYGGWIEYGGSRGRPLVAQGRYVLPAAKQQEQPFHDRCEHAAEHEIKGMQWQSPR